MTPEKWNKKSHQSWCFQLGEEPELIHVIKTGFEDLYMVLHEDAYQFSMGKVDFRTKKEIEVEYRVKLK